MLTWYDIAGKILLVRDRGYSSYALFASLLERENTEFLIRVKQGRGAMKCIADLPMREFDRQVKFTITTTQAKEFYYTTIKKKYYFFNWNKITVLHYLLKNLRNPGADGEQLLRDIVKYVVPVKPGQQNTWNLRAQSWRGFGYRVSV